MKSLQIIFAVVCLQFVNVNGNAADWADFRGPNGNPVHNGNLPLSWDVQGKKNVAWKASLPGRGV
ncbi:MAG: serine/threonine protein kinase, partial [Planctomycetaceae bacterium]|nr:serine/threonine protein kinase [Planctomycetaceae bacterium]